MADGNREPRRRFGRRGRGRQKEGGQREAPKPAEKPAERKSVLADQPPVMCAICEKQIFDLSSALAGREGSAPVHFDCALAQASAGEQLGPLERVSYIGRGAFAVIEYRDKSMTSFVVKRRIQWEKEGEKFDWRKGILQRMGL